MYRWRSLAALLTLAGCAARTPAATGTLEATLAASATQAAVVRQSPATVGVTGASAWLQGSAAQTNLMVGADGNTYLGLWVRAPESTQGQVAQRAPLDVALVIDVSGSMSGEKIQRAREAAQSFVESMAQGDIVSVYAFSNSVFEVTAPTVLDSSSQARVVGQIRNLQAMGGTNMFDGLRVGEAAVARAPATHPVRRVVVISDGQANIGPSSPQELGDLAALGTEGGAQVTAIGVGLDYDEHTLGALAVRSTGRLYHLEDPAQMTTILHNELNLMATTVAANAYLEVEPAPGVELSGLEENRVDRVGTTLRIPLGSLHSGQQRELLLRARINTSAAGDRPLGRARLVFQDTARNNAPRSEEVPLAVTITRDATAAQGSANDRVQTMVANHEAAQLQLRAVEQLNAGNAQQAVAALAESEARLRSAAAAARSEPERQRLSSAASNVSRVRARASSAASSPTPARAMRGAALDTNANAYDAMGY